MLGPSDRHEVAYFSMEIALEPHLPTYAGGLGILAGDTLRAAADLGVPMVGVTLLHRKGYFQQKLDDAGNQSAVSTEWSPEAVLELMKPVVAVPMEGREVKVRAWRYVIEGVGNDVVPVYLLDTKLEENQPEDRTLTDQLYGGDDRYRLCQEAILGLGGVALLARLGHAHVRSYHMNEGHSALLTLGLLKQRIGGRRLSEATADDVHAVRAQCVFTTHTPVPAGHDQFTRELTRQVLGEDFCQGLAQTKACPSGLNMTQLGLYSARYVNGVAMQHGATSRGLYPDYPIRAITNGVHAVRWTRKPFADLYDRHIPEWRRDNLYLRYAIGIPLNEIAAAHADAKRELLGEIFRRTGKNLDPEALTVGFGRRAAVYKRGDFIFSDLERLKAMDQRIGPLQFVFAGKAHPRDEGGQATIRKIVAAARELGERIPVVYLEDFDWALAHLLVAGSDLWLNTPRRPQEASGTSGMKAALNGVPSLSVLDGWWIEGCIEGATGWAIGESAELEESEQAEATSMYSKLEQKILPMFYGRRSAYTEAMRNAIAINGSFFNAQRMISQYVSNAYFAAQEPELSASQRPRA